MYRAAKRYVAADDSWTVASVWFSYLANISEAALATDSLSFRPLQVVSY